MYMHVVCAYYLQFYACGFLCIDMHTFFLVCFDIFELIMHIQCIQLICIFVHISCIF